jgi:hypothetical protein
VRRAFAFLLALVALTMSADVKAERSQLIRLLDASFKCSPERERFETESASFDVKYQYRFVAEDATMQIIVHYLAIALESPAKRFRFIEEHRIASVRFSDIEVFRSRDPAFDRTVYISCTTDRPCISTTLISEHSTPPRPEHAADDGKAQVEASQQFDSFAASFFLCDAQAAEYVRGGLSEIITLARGGEAPIGAASGHPLRRSGGRAQR